MRKRFSFLLEEESIHKLDSIRHEPVSRSQLVDAVLLHVLEHPDFLSSFVEREQEKINQVLQTVQVL